jgi:peptidyl-prolyl cis-trans isomerase B (cyclophilin B)
VASSKSRQRKLERERYERKLVRRAQQQRRRRRIQAGIGVFLTLAVLGTGTAWLMGAFDEPESGPEAIDRCTWIPQEDPTRVDVGTPPENPADEGARVATLELDAGEAGTGEIAFEMNLADEPCGAASLEHLAAAGFYDGLTCHELTADGALRCGSPDGTNEGGPSYSFYAENWPVEPPGEDPATGTPDATESPDAQQEAPTGWYPAGTVALADVVGASGSQLLFFYEDSTVENPTWPVLGTVTSGLDLLAEIAAADGAGELPGPPAEQVEIVSLTVAESGAPDES